MILTSVGSIVYKTWHNYLKPHALEVLASRGAIGHIGGHFYDENGIEIPTSLRDRMIGINLEDIKKTNEVICVAGSEEKAEAVLGTVRGGFIDTLIIDELCVHRILDIIRHRSGGYAD